MPTSCDDHFKGSVQIRNLGTVALRGNGFDLPDKPPNCYVLVIAVIKTLLMYVHCFYTEAQFG